MLKYEIQATRINEHGSDATCKQAKLLIDTDVNGREDAFNPAELFLAALAACILKNMERIAPMINFEFSGVRVKIHGQRQDSPPKMKSIQYEIIVDTPESDHKLTLMHENIRKFGTIYNTMADTCELTGVLGRSKLKN